MRGEALSYLFDQMATKEDIRELRSEMRTVKAELHADIADVGKRMMEAFVTFQNWLFTHVLALIGALTAIMTLLLLLIR